MVARTLIADYTCQCTNSMTYLIFLQHACGYEYTNKLHRMFTDISISSDLNSSFNDFLSNADVSLGVGFTLFVLQVSYYMIISNFTCVNLACCPAARFMSPSGVS